MRSRQEDQAKEKVWRERAVQTLAGIVTRETRGATDKEDDFF